MSNCTVTNVTTHTTSNGLDVEVTITRDWRIFTGSQPNANDVPRDIRDALVKWLWTVPNDPRPNLVAAAGTGK